MNKEVRKCSIPGAVEQLSHYIVSTWVSECRVSLRPSIKSALKNLLAKSFPDYMEHDGYQHLEGFIALVSEQERKACVEAIYNLKEEPFSGFVSKQQALNACEYRELETMDLAEELRQYKAKAGSIDHVKQTQ